MCTPPVGMAVLSWVMALAQHAGVLPRATLATSPSVAPLPGSMPVVTGKLDKSVTGVRLSLPSPILRASQKTIAKARIGLDLGHGLVFGTLGYGQADLKHILQDYGHTTSSTLTFQVAAGYERPFLERWSVRSEASVMTFGSATASFDGMYKAPILHIWTVKIGLTQHF